MGSLRGNCEVRKDLEKKVQVWAESRGMGLFSITRDSIADHIFLSRKASQESNSHATVVTKRNLLLISHVTCNSFFIFFSRRENYLDVWFPHWLWLYWKFFICFDNSNFFSVNGLPHYRAGSPRKKGIDLCRQESECPKSRRGLEASPYRWGSLEGCAAWDPGTHAVCRRPGPPVGLSSRYSLGLFFSAWLSSFGLTRRQGSGLDLLDSKQDFEVAELVWLPEELSLSRLEEWFTLVWDQWEESCCWQLVCAWKLDLDFLCTSKANSNDHFHPPLLLVCVCACFAWSSGRRWCQIMRGVALPWVGSLTGLYGCLSSDCCDKLL